MKNPLIYAYIGDSVYETYVRRYLINQGISKMKDIQNSSLDYVSAKSQRRLFESILNKLSDEELEIFKWGRNAKGGKSKASDIVTYRIATGFECLFGYLYLNNNEERIEELFNKILEVKE